MDTKTPENKKNSPRLKVLIIILSVLLVLSAGGLAAKYVYDNFFASDRASVTVPDAGQNAVQDGEQDTEQNAVQDGQNDPADGGDEPEDGTNAGSDTADDDTTNGGNTDVGTGNGGQSDGADA